VVQELEQRLHECQLELDYLDKENELLAEEYSNLRTKFIASEEGVDYLMQRLEVLKGMIEEKEQEVDDSLIALFELVELLKSLLLVFS
jgi:ABC-type Zn uptake system ZnuABC Zn-binding protein ZnuA